uniref:(northern house mosquito) hypothetical protein n=1 Tax=Culex pipiens TaxID=7175 RepID=A0A8D8I0A3_CULPI
MFILGAMSLLRWSGTPGLNLGDSRCARARMAVLKVAEGGSAGRKTSDFFGLLLESFTRAKLGAFGTECRAARSTRGRRRSGQCRRQVRAIEHPTIGGFKLKLKRIQTLYCTHLSAYALGGSTRGVVAGWDPNFQSAIGDRWVFRKR